MLYAILAAVLVALDQLVKYLVVQNIPLGEHVPFLPYLLDLTYVENTGAAFSLFSDHTWILALISLVMSVLLAIAVWKPLFRHPFGRTALALLLAGAVGNLIDRALQGYVVDMFHVLFMEALLLAGAVGNLIDRALQGYVVDMFHVLFMEFAVFNVADICVVVGGFAAVVYYLFFYEKLEGKPKDSGAAQGEQA